MEKSFDGHDTVCLIGEGKLTNSIAKNLAMSGQATVHLTPESKWPDFIPCDLAIVISEENVALKKQTLQRLESCVSKDTTIAINTESILLSELQENRCHEGRMIGLNWSYPAESSFFLEIITNENTNPVHVETVEDLARREWGKDPYVVSSGFSVRGRLFAAMAKEAFYLVENDYATIESIDRSCRNDAGYYMAFAGNFRYMDLMGTAVYGIVMETLNSDLASQKEVGEQFLKLMEEGRSGMVTESGFYKYNRGDDSEWEEITRQFAVKIRELMENYPITFNYDTKISVL